MAARQFPGMNAAWCAVSAAGLLLALSGHASAQNWDRFRGPNGAGQGEGESISAKWGVENYLWRRPLGGIGHSSPVVWGDRVFVTSADRESAEQIVTAFDADSGLPVWERRLAGKPYALHAQSSFASSTPAVDARRLYYLWRTGDVAWIIAYTHAGEEAWRRELGPATDENGFGVSPIVIDDLVVVTVENETAESAMTGFDAATGAVRWRVPRPSGKSPYCTPTTMAGANGKTLLITASTASGICAFDPADGSLVWQGAEKDLPQRVVGSPIVAGDLVIVSCGVLGNGLHTLAVRAGAGSAAPTEAYRIKENVPYVPTPVVVGGLLFVWNDRGIVSCHELATGEQLWRQRVGGNFNCSPIHVGGQIFCASMEGEMVVLSADRRYRLLARNELGEPTSATPAFAGGRMYVRTESTLLCVGPAGGAGN